MLHMLWLWDTEPLTFATTTTTQAPFPQSSALRAEFVCNKPAMLGGAMEGFNTRIKKHVSAVQCFLITLDHSCIFFACQGEPGVPGQKVSSPKLQLQLLSPEMQSAQMWL